MIKEPSLQNIQTPENQPPPPVDSLDDGRQKSDEEIKNEILFNRKKDSNKSPDLSKISYDDLVKQYPVKAVKIAIEKLSSHNMGGDGIGIAELLIKSKGWDFFVNHAFSLDIGEAGIGHKSYVICGLRECMHKLGNPETLPISKIEKLLQHTDNDIEWMSIKSLIDLRQKAENLDAFSGNELISIAMDNDVDFFNEKRVREEAAQIIYDNPEEYYGLMEELYQGLREMWTDYEGGPDTKIIIDTMRERENMSVEELLDSIYPVFSFNIVTKYYTHKEVGEKFVLKEEKIRKKLQKYSQANTKVFYTSMWRQELKEKDEQLIGGYFNEYNIIPALGEFASEEGKQSNEKKFGYALNSTITPISKNTLMMHSPTGRTLALIDSDKKVEEKFENTEDIMKIASFLTHTNRLGERQYSLKDTSIAACLVFWDVVPEPIKDGFRHSFEYHGFSEEELDNLLNHARTQHFEGIIHTASEYGSIFNHQIVDRMHEFISKELKERTESSSPHFVGPEEFLDSINIEHGETSIALEDLNNDISLLNFQTLKYLQSNLDFDLSLLSRKEFYSLLMYLKNSKDGDGFNNIKDFIGDIDKQGNKFNRIKSFLSLESGQLSGEQIIDISDELKDDSELANKLFSEYANLIDSANQRTDEMAKIYNSIFFEKHVDRDKVMRRIMNRGVNLLIEAGQALSSSQDKEKIVGELMRNLKTEETVQKRMLSDFQAMYKELENIEKKLFEYDFDEILNVFFYNHLNEFQETLDGDDKENFSNDFHIYVSSKSIKEGEKMWMTYEKLWRRYANKKSEELLKSQMVDIYRYLSEEHGSKRDKSKSDEDIIGEFEEWNRKQSGILSLEKNLDEYLQRNIYGDEVLDENLSDDLVKEFLSGNVMDSGADSQNLEQRKEDIGSKIQSIIESDNSAKEKLKSILSISHSIIEGFNQGNKQYNDYEYLYGFFVSIKELRDKSEEARSILKDVEAELSLIIEFLDKGEDENSKLNRLKSMSHDLNEDRVAEVMEIENQLKNHPGVADKIFTQYAEMVDTMNECGRRICILYEEVFGGNELDKEQIVQISLNRSSKMLLDLSKELKEVDDNKKEEVTHKLIYEMRRREKIRIRQLSDLASISNDFQKCKQDLLSELFIQGGEHKVMCEIFGDPEKYNSPDELNRAIESGEITPWWMNADLNVDKFFEKIDSKMLGNIILASKKSIRSLRKMLRDEGYDKMMDDEQIKKFGEPDPVDVKKFERYNSEIESGKSKIKKAKEVLQFQKNFERRFNDLVYGNRKRDLSENLGPTISDRLFQKYQEIIDQTKTTKEQLKSLFKSQKEISDEELDKVTEIILKKANHLLLSYSKRIGEGEDIDEQELVNELEGYKADLILTASVWKSVDKSDLSFEDLEGVNFEVETIGRITSEGKVMSIVDEISQKETDEKHPFIPGANIRGVVSKYAHEANPEERQRAQEILEMIDIYYKNYTNKPDLRKIIVDGFIDKLKVGSNDTLVYLYKKDGQILAFNRFDKMKGDSKYFGSFNVEPSLHDSAIGSALLKASLGEEAKDSEIEADCDPEATISSYYVEKAGFVVDSIKPKYAGTKHTIFGIERKKENEQYEFRKMSHEELVAEHEQRFRGNVYRKDLPKMVLKFEKDSNELFESSERLVNSEGYVMTRYFFDKGGKHAYCAFERGGN